MRPLRAAALLLFACAAAQAADRDFNRVVNAMETWCGKPHTNIPFMGVANFFVKVARPAGTTSFHLAVFDHVDGFAPGRDSFMRALDTASLHPLVQASSRDGEATYVLAADPGKSTRLLIASFSRDSVVVVEVRVNPAALRRTIDHPQSMVDSWLGKHDSH